MDTGSSDDTMETARRHGAKVSQTQWNNDFSEARNASIDRATGEWILILDADEAIASEDHDRIRDLIAEYPDAAFMFNQWTYTKDSTTFGWRPLEKRDSMNSGEIGYFQSQQVRLFSLFYLA